MRSPEPAPGGTAKSRPQSGQRTVAMRLKTPEAAGDGRGRSPPRLRRRPRSPARPCGRCAKRARRAPPRPRRRSSPRTPHPSAKETLSPRGRTFRLWTSRRSPSGSSSVLLVRGGHRIAPQRRGPAAATSARLSVLPGRGAVASHALRCSTEQKKLMRGQVYVCSGRVRSSSAAQTRTPEGAPVTMPLVRVRTTAVRHP